MSSKTLPLKVHLQRLVWVCLTPSVVVIALLALALAERLQAERTDDLRDYAQSLAASLDAEILSRIHGLQALGAGAPKLRGPEAYALWHRLISAYDTTFDAPVLLADAERNTLLHSRQPPGQLLPAVAKPKGRSALSDAAATGQPAVGDLVKGAVLQEMMVAVAVPMVGERSDLIAMALIPVTHLTQSLAAKPPPSGWKVQLLDSVGQVMAPLGEAAIPEPGLFDRPRYLEVELSHAPWTVKIGVEFAEFYKHRLLLLSLIVLGTVSTVAGAVWAARSLSTSLNASIQRIGRDLHGDARHGAGTPPNRASLVAEIEAAREELKRLDLAKRDAQENERRRIARDLHDSLQQDLAALRMHLDLINGSQNLTPEALKALCVKATALAQGSIHELDRIVKDLRPWLLEQLGPAVAIEQLVDSYRQTTSLQMELEVVGEEAAFEALAASVASGVFRVTQECLTNTVKHAQASFVHIVLDFSQPGCILLSVSDDGVGIADADHDKPQSRGLRGMAERIAALDGTLEISRGHADNPDHGTTVKVSIPVRAA